MFELFLWVILASFATEAIVEITTKSELFSPIMTKLALREDFFSRLVTCPYCFSVWVSGILTIVLWYQLEVSFLFIPILIFSIHRLSNIIHDLDDRINIGKRKRNVGRNKRGSF